MTTGGKGSRAIRGIAISLTLSWVGCYNSSIPAPPMEDAWIADATGPDSGSEPDPGTDPWDAPDPAPDVGVDSRGDPGVVPDPAPDPEAEEGDPTGNVGEHCNTSADCTAMPEAGRTCLTCLMGYLCFPGGYCSASCTSSSECGPEGDCVDLLGLGTFCLDRCASYADCRTWESYECMTISGVTGTYCVPPGSCPGRGYDCSFHREINPFDPLIFEFRQRIRGNAAPP